MRQNWRLKKNQKKVLDHINYQSDWLNLLDEFDKIKLNGMYFFYKKDIYE